MDLPAEIGEKAIRDVITEHAEIGKILERHGIGCVTCGVGICLVKDVVVIHGLPAEEETAIAAEIAAYLDKTDETKRGETI